MIWALSFLEDFERYGFDTYKVPVEVSKPSDLSNPMSVFEFKGHLCNEASCNFIPNKELLENIKMWRERVLNFSMSTST